MLMIWVDAATRFLIPHFGEHIGEIILVGIRVFFKLNAGSGL